MKLRSFLLAMMLCAFCVTQASALEYTFDAPEDYLFGQPTSDDTIYEWENPNMDRSKNTALIAPGFGSPTSYLSRWSCRKARFSPLGSRPPARLWQIPPLFWGTATPSG